MKNIRFENLLNAGMNIDDANKFMIYECTYKGIGDLLDLYLESKQQKDKDDIMSDLKELAYDIELYNGSHIGEI